MKIQAGKERGVALVVTLVLLLVALILGITSYQNARLEEVMAGNQRAASLALMAAEFGASDFSYSVGPELVLPVRDPNTSDTYESYMAAILSAFRDWASAEDNALLENCSSISVSVANTGDSTSPNSCYVISARGVGGTSELVSVDVDGMVYSGNLNGIDYASGALSSLPDNLVSRRTIRLLVGVIIGESLSPLNFVGELTDYDGIRSQASLEGEEDVDGYVNPAISVSTKEEAEKIVRDILKDPDGDISDRAVFVPKDASCEGSACDVGVFHSVDVVNADGEYEGDYGNCDTTNNNLCNYQGGIASTLGAPILTKPADFDAFVSAAVDPTGTSELGTYSAPLWLTQSEAVSYTSDSDQVYFVTNQDSSVGYTRPVWDDYYIRDSDADLENPDLARMEKPYMDLGGFDKSGVLIIDGDVEFDGNPEFEGLIIVLGDYKINGSGNDPYTGAIIAAPYSTHYTDSSGADLVPFRDSSGYFLDASGNRLPDSENPVGPGAKVVSELVSILVEGDPDNPAPTDVYEYSYESYVIGADGGRLDFEPFYAPPDCDLAQGCVPALQSDGSVVAESRFDPIGVDVNGGGKQPYNYDYQVLQRAFDLLSDAARVRFIVGQARPDGSYEYGVKGWGEVVVPPDV